jgi:hypothetical protein
MSEEPPVEERGEGTVAVRHRRADGSPRVAFVRFLAIEWQAGDDAKARVLDLIAKAVEAAAEEERRGRYAAGPKGRLP